VATTLHRLHTQAFPFIYYTLYVQPLHEYRIHKDHNSQRERWDTKWSWHVQESQCNCVHFDMKFTQWIHVHTWDHLYSYTKCPHADYVITQGHRSRSGLMDTGPVYYAAWVWLRFGGKLLNCCNFIPSRRCNLKIFLQGHGARPC